MSNITYKWSIATLDRYTQDGYVYIAHWVLKASAPGVNSHGIPLYATAAGAETLERPDHLIPYDSLSEEMVLGWVKDKMGEKQVRAIESALADEISEIENPSRETGVPW